MGIQIKILNMPLLGLPKQVTISCQTHFDMSNETPPPKSSLDLLLSETAKPTWSPPWTSSAEWLKQHSTTILENLEPPNNQNPGYAMIDHYHVAEFPSDGSLAKSTKSVQLYGRDKYVRFRSKLVSSNPGLRLEVFDTTSKLDDTAGKATVCVTCRLLNYTHVDMKPRESVVFMDWVRRKGDHWVCVKSKVMHGHSHLPAFPTASLPAEADRSSAEREPSDPQEEYSTQPDNDTEMGLRST